MNDRFRGRGKSDVSLRRDGGLISLLLPGDAAPLRGTAALCLSIPQHHLHPNRRILLKQTPGLLVREDAEPPVLLPLERLCSARKHPLSSVSGRQRYNTLDLASKIVCHETAGFIGFFLPRRALPSIGFHPPRQPCRLWKPLPRALCPLWIPLPTGRSRPYWKPRAKGIAIPLES